MTHEAFQRELLERIRGESYGAGLADLDGPPDGLEDVVPGQQIEILEDGVRRGLLTVICVWTRGEGHRPESLEP